MANIFLALAFALLTILAASSASAQELGARTIQSFSDEGLRLVQNLGYGDYAYSEHYREVTVGVQTDAEARTITFKVTLPEATMTGWKQMAIETALKRRFRLRTSYRIRVVFQTRP